MNSRLLLASLLLTVIFISCSKRANKLSECDKLVTVDLVEFQTTPQDQMTINSLDLDGHCLSVNFSAGGCDGNSWVVRLIDAGFVLESNPPQRNLRLSLKNDELCEAFITKEVSFDLRELRTTGNVVILNINDSDNQIMYKY